MRMPEATRRLFPAIEVDALESTTATDFVIGRVLEEGDRRDLRWLCGETTEATLGEWLGRRADRQLSRRSRAFWSLILSLQNPDVADERHAGPVAADNPLWPL